MSSFVGFFLSYLLLYKYTALFWFVFFAGLVIPIPVNVLLLAIGAFSYQQYFDFNTSLWVATFANIIGDILNYLFFYKFGHAILRDKYAQKYNFFIRLEENFKKSSGISIIISRIIGIFGMPVNFLAGFLKTSFWKFLFYDTIGNFLFVLIFLGVGYVVGDEWVAIYSLVSNIVWILAVAILIWVVIFLHRQNK